MSEELAASGPGRRPVERCDDFNVPAFFPRQTSPTFDKLEHIAGRPLVVEGPIGLGLMPGIEEHLDDFDAQSIAGENGLDDLILPGLTEGTETAMIDPMLPVPAPRGLYVVESEAVPLLQGVAEVNLCRNELYFESRKGQANKQGEREVKRRGVHWNEIMDDPLRSTSEVLQYLVDSQKGHPGLELASLQALTPLFRL